MALVERFVYTLKERLYRYLTHKDTWRYVDVLQRIVDSYNNSKHSATKMIPASMIIRNASTRKKDASPQYAVGNLVRISRARNVFAKGFGSGLIVKFFKISRISLSHQPHVYHLKDLASENVNGVFYEQELCRVRKDLIEKYFEIDEILK